MQFYEELSKHYDGMTQFEARFEKERGFFEDLTKKYGLKKILDAGCGTGFHSILLARLGLDVTGIDSSRDMLKKAGDNAADHNVKVQFYQSTFQDMTICMDDRFDAVCCMGNSLPHLLTEGEVVLCLKNFHNLLNDDGLLVIQNLNYDRIMQTKERVVSVKKSDGKVFVRFYDFDKEIIRFHILVLEENRNGFSPELLSTDLKPVYQDQLQEWLSWAGFRNVESKGNLGGEKFSKDQSKDLIMLARKIPEKNKHRVVR